MGDMGDRALEAREREEARLIAACCAKTRAFAQQARVFVAQAAKEAEKAEAEKAKADADKPAQKAG